MASTVFGQPLGEEFYPLAFSRENLTVNTTNCSIDKGGYVKIGKLVIVNIRLALTSSGKAAGGKTFVSGFPVPLRDGENTLNVVSLSNQTKDVTVIITYEGNLNSTNATTETTQSGLLIAGVYICE